MAVIGLWVATNTGNAICTYFQYHQAVTAPWAPPWADTKGTRDVLVSVVKTGCINCVRTYDVHNRTNSGVIHSLFTCVTTSHEQHAVNSLTLCQDI